METVTLTFANFKGGTGKTTNATMLGYALSKRGFKTLVVDLDPQANATALYLKTYRNKNNADLAFDKTLMGAIMDEDLSSVVMKIDDNLFLLPSYKDFARYSDYLEDIIPKRQRNKRPQYFAELLADIKDDYDFVLLDVPPTISVITDSALAASDYAIIIMQTQERSLVGGRTFIEEMIEIAQQYNSSLDLLGVLPVILKPRALVDEATLTKASEMFGPQNMFKTIVPYMERLKRYDVIGITENHRDVHDNRTHALYNDLTTEVLERLGVLQHDGN